MRVDKSLIFESSGLRMMNLSTTGNPGKCRRPPWTCNFRIDNRGQNRRRWLHCHIYGFTWGSCHIEYFNGWTFESETCLIHEIYWWWGTGISHKIMPQSNNCGHIYQLMCDSSITTLRLKFPHPVAMYTCKEERAKEHQRRNVQYDEGGG